MNSIVLNEGCDGMAEGLLSVAEGRFWSLNVGGGFFWLLIDFIFHINEMKFSIQLTQPVCDAHRLNHCKVPDYLKTVFTDAHMIFELLWGSTHEIIVQLHS